MAKIKLDHVSLKIGNSEILEDISFELNQEEIVGLVGPNGAGKSSTIKLITRFYSPAQGEILLNDKKITLLKTSYYPISYIPDEPIFYDYMTVEEHLIFVNSMYSGRKCYTLSELIKILDLTPHLNKTPGTLSKGTRQKLMIALSLIRNFDFLIADEPFSGLDPEQAHIFKKILLTQKEHKKSVLISTHQLGLIEDICDKYIMIEQGKVIAYGAKKEILAQYGFSSDMSLEQCYLSILKSRREIYDVPG